MPHWPRGLPRSLPRPHTTLHYNLEVAATRYPRKPAVGFFGRNLDYASLHAEVLAVAGWLRRSAGVQRGDRVVVFMQNSPQWLVACYGALRCDASVVPVNPMYRADELNRVLRDSGARVAFCAQDLAETLREGATGTDLRCIVVAAYSDYLPESPDYALAEWLTRPRTPVPDCTGWSEVLAARERPPASVATPDDVALLPYTSGSSGQSRGCVHTHGSFMHVTAGMALWHGQSAATVFLGAPPMYQVSGLANSVNCPLFSGGLVLPLPRWDRSLALQLIERYRATHVALAPTAIVDLLAAPDLAAHDLTSICRLTSGGATMPAAVWHKVHAAFGVPFLEAYGLTETAATTHINPAHRPKPQCLGIPFFDTQSRVVDPDTLRPVATGEQGEIVLRGPQLFQGYWNNPEATREAHVEVEGERYFRTGDIGYVDEDGYYFMTDRRKRMINASGYKVWPAEIETRLYEHPDIAEACVVSSPDPYRGETVKAIVVLKEGRSGKVSESDIIEWSRGKMAAYKYPRKVQFVDGLPKSPVGKILWRSLQEREWGN